jgi:hypothetical protein
VLHTLPYEHRTHPGVDLMGRVAMVPVSWYRDFQEGSQDIRSALAPPPDPATAVMNRAIL